MRCYDGVADFGTGAALTSIIGTAQIYEEGIWWAINGSGMIFNLTAYDTSTQHFIYSVNYSTSAYTSATAYLYYNGTAYSTSVTMNSGLLTATRSLEMPLVSSNTINSIKFVVNLINSTGVNQTNSTLLNQTVMPTNYSICDATNTYNKVNFTFKDESNGNTLNGSILGTSIDYWLGDGTYYKTLTAGNTTEYRSISFCSNNNYGITNDIYLPYSYGTYPQRIYNRQKTFGTTTENITLYLLSSTEGQYTTFQVINAADQPLEDVFVMLNKSISGVQTIISSGYTGADGGITFWLNPDDQYTVSAFLSPYPSYSTTQAFTQDSYTITLGSSSSINVSDYNKGMTYSFKPTDEWLSNGTTYNFNLTLSSSYWSLDRFGFNITNGSGLFLGRSNSTTSTGGVVSLDLNTGQNKTLVVTYFWTINNVTTQFKRTYRILDFSQNQYSLTRALSDFATYKGTGFFGLTDFGLGIIIFFVIVGTVGTAKVKFGISDEATLAGLLFAVVALFDVGFGLIPNPVNAIQYFPTVVIGILFIGFAVKEMRA